MKKNTVSAILAISTLIAAVSCQKEEYRYGYLKMEMRTVSSTIESKVSALPENYDSRQFYVEIIDASGNVVKSTGDFASDDGFKEAIALTPGTYAINAHSNAWDGSDSAFESPYYAGSTTVTIAPRELKTASVVCTLANVKVSVNFDESFMEYFKTADALVKSKTAGVSELDFVMGKNDKAGYFPAGDLIVTLTAENMKGVTNSMTTEISDVKAREFVKINYRISDAGSLGGVTVGFDDTTHTYDFNIAIPRNPAISFGIYNADAWSRFANLKAEITGRTEDFDVNAMSIRWKKKVDSEWSEVPYSSLKSDGENVYTYKLCGLSPDTVYQYKVHYGADDSFDSDVVEFKTDKETSLYNGGFEYWYTDGKVQYPNEKGTSYWNTSNPGSATYIGSVSVKETGFVHSGSACAKLQTKYAVIKLAAASVYTGDYKGLIGTSGAKMDWGVPFNSRPTALKGFWSYSPGSINRGTRPDGAPAKGSKDNCNIFCVLLTEQLHVGGSASSGIYEKSTTINWNNDPRVIAYGELSKDTDNSGKWEEFNVTLKYHTLDAKPEYMAIVFAASKWGDYFYGSDSSVLYVDDLEFVYGDEVEVK